MKSWLKHPTWATVDDKPLPAFKRIRHYEGQLQFPLPVDQRTRRAKGERP